MAVISIGYFRNSKNGFALITLFGIVCIVSRTRGDEFSEPYFAEPIPNVTVSEGSDVTLTCVVRNLGTYQVAWIHMDRYAILTVHYHVITQNPRYSLTHYTDGTWRLHISDVRVQDKGKYLCQINTKPMKDQMTYITVVENRPTSPQTIFETPYPFLGISKTPQNGNNMSNLESESEGRSRSERERPKSALLLSAIFACLLSNIGLQNSAI